MVNRYLKPVIQTPSSLLITAITRALKAVLTVSVGNSSTEANVYTVGMLIKSFRADFGIMISASHNPYFDNGVKIFGSDGVKISQKIEQQIEDYINSSDRNSTKEEFIEFGRVKRLDDVIGRYVEYIKSSIQNTEAFFGLKVLFFREFIN
jgi:phosphomannomutase